MHFHIVAVGRLKRGVERDLFDHYARRIKWPFEMHEVEDRKADGPGRKAREAALIEASLPAGATIVALDETGRDLGSDALAKRVAEWRDNGVADLAFVIGGADGLTESLRRRAQLVVAFGRATWPHLLVRGMLAEQLYRAQQILAGHPYHRG